MISDTAMHEAAMFLRISDTALHKAVMICDLAIKNYQLAKGPPTLRTFAIYDLWIFDTACDLDFMSYSYQFYYRCDFYFYELVKRMCFTFMNCDLCF